MSNLWNGFRDLFIDALELLHGLFRFIGDEPAWGFAIIALTLIVRVLMLPLAIKQTHSMRAMQALQPKIKAIQKKYKADREMMRKDPERYKSLRAKQNEEMTALYRDAGVNPVGGCLPLLAQAPIFLALFSVLRAPMEGHPAGTALGDLLRSDFYFFTPDATGLSTSASAAGAWGIVLIVLMAGSMFWSQRQMIAKNAAVGTDTTQAQQQKIMMYVMPVFLAVISFNFPMGVLLYWVTTNVWQIAQQAIILHEVEEHPEGPGAPAATPAKGKGSTSSKGKGSTPSKGKPTGGSRTRGKAKGTPAPDAASPAKSNGQPKPKPKPKPASNHLPSRRSRGGRG